MCRDITSKFQNLEYVFGKLTCFGDAVDTLPTLKHIGGDTTLARATEIPKMPSLKNINGQIYLLYGAIPLLDKISQDIQVDGGVTISSGSGNDINLPTLKKYLIHTGELPNISGYAKKALNTVTGYVKDIHDKLVLK